MSLTERESNKQQHPLVSSSDIGDVYIRKTRRSSSIYAVVEPNVLVAEEEEDADGETATASTPFALSGILYNLLASFLFVASTFSIKELQIDLLDAPVVRSILQIFLFAAYVKYHRYPLWIGSSKERWLQFVLCILNGMIFLGYNIGVRYLPMPDFTTLIFTRLFWTIVFGVLIYKEKATMMVLLAVCFTLVGVVFVAQPTFLFKQNKAAEVARNITDIANMYSVNSRVTGILLSLVTSVLCAFSLLIFKQLITLELKPSVLVLQHSIVGLLCLVVNQFYKYFLLNNVTFFTWTIFQWKYWLATIINLLQTVGIICGIRAIKREPPSVVTIVSASDIIYAVLFTEFIYKEEV